jgi:dUTP pyrophosphatase
MRFFEEVTHKKYESETILPKRSDDGSAGYDFRIKEDVTLEPGESKLCFTDVKAFFPENEVLLIYIRSSLGVKWGINLKNGTGVIDSSYYFSENEGNIGLPLINNSKKKVVIQSGERVAQGIFMPYLLTNDDQPAKERREGEGFGSSGRF